MKRLLTAFAVSFAIFIATAATAFAADPVQSSTQSSSTGQAAYAASSATQVDPSNQNISVRVLSPGNDGAVSQENEASSNANAANTATTDQTATQNQSSGCSCAPSLSSGDISSILPGAMQAAAPASSPASDATTAAPAAPAATQSNDASSAGTSGNAAPTTQTATQSAPSGVQSSTQDATTDQGAIATSSATQIKPSNSNISVRVLSPGNDGSVDQSNKAKSSADATNSAATTQSSTQNQSGGGSGVQSTTQDAGTSQLAAGLSSATQVKPENSNISVRVLSPGNNGSVSQENEAKSHANAENTAPVTQTATQNDPTSSSSCGCYGSHGTSVQAIGQKSDIGQIAGAASSATQFGASNSNDPVRIGSWGNDGSVNQENEAKSHASATNDAPVMQTGTQNQSGSSCGCSGTGVQALGQKSEIGQLAGALSSATQVGPSNESGGVRIKSGGNGGSVSQENEAKSSADSSNEAPVTQTGTQNQSGSGVQALGQKSGIYQAGFALSSATQLPGRKSECGCGSSFGNSADPVRIGSYGNDGNVEQKNTARSSADSSNTATPTQTATQTQSGSGCGCSGLGVQALGQKSDVWQLGVALSSAKQIGASNSYAPVRIKSFGGGGYTKQENEAKSRSDAPNLSTILQAGTQVMV